MEFFTNKSTKLWLYFVQHGLEVFYQSVQTVNVWKLQSLNILTDWNFSVHDWEIERH